MKVVELIYKSFRLQRKVYTYVCMCVVCIQYERLYAHKINCASATLRKHEKETIQHPFRDLENCCCCCCGCCTSRQFQVHGNWSRFGTNLWTRRLSSITISCSYEQLCLLFKQFPKRQYMYVHICRNMHA